MTEKNVKYDVIYQIDIDWKGNERVWAIFNGVWCADFKITTEVVGLEEATKWLREQTDGLTFVPGFNFAENQEAVEVTRKQFDASMDGFQPYNWVWEKAKEGNFQLRFSNKDISLEISMRPISLSIYDSTESCTVTCISLHDREHGLRFEGEHIGETYANLVAGMGQAFAGEVFALYEIDTPPGSAVQIGEWMVTLEYGIPSAGPIMVSLHINPTIVGYEIDVRRHLGGRCSEQVSVFHVPHPDELDTADDETVRELLQKIGYVDSLDWTILAAYHFNDSPYYHTGEPFVKFSGKSNLNVIVQRCIANS